LAFLIAGMADASPEVAQPLNSSMGLSGAACTPDHHAQHSGSAEGWRWLNPSGLGKPERCPWLSGFSRASQAEDIESLSPPDFFKWLADVLQLSEGDIDVLQACHDLPHTIMAEHIYSRFLECKAIRLHLQLATNSEITARKQMVQKYLAWLLSLRGKPADTYVRYIDHIASLHQRKHINVPSTQLLAGLGVTHDIIMQHVCDHVEDKQQLHGVARAVSKLMWIQAAFFFRHSSHDRPMRVPLSKPRCLLVLWLILCSRRFLARVSGGLVRALILDFAAALAGSALLLQVCQR